ncbi:unnamed protein product [Vicia faba]|uniref:PB1-like domain-containing protein n=1 Tax=Vicia faba TaxID=3906 RepID=A0AAV0ZP67_VICFA|nr:unnamed protein product [Vicia faba]
MEEILNITIHHSGQFVSEDLSVYEGGEIADLRVDDDMWGYFELLGAIKELGYPAIEKIYYKDPTAGMNLLFDDKGALEIADLYRVHLRVEVFIQHPLSQPEYVDESEVILDEIPLNKEAIEDVVGQKEASEDVVIQNEASEDDVGQKEASENAVGQNDDDSSDDDSSDDSSFSYDSAKEVVFDDETDDCDTDLEEEEGMAEVTDLCETEPNKEDSKGSDKGSDNESEDLFVTVVALRRTADSPQPHIGLHRNFPSKLPSLLQSYENRISDDASFIILREFQIQNGKIEDFWNPRI